MSELQKINLILHVLLGVLAVAATYAVWIGLLRREPAWSRLRWWSLVGFTTIVLSWLTGGHYYVTYYGAKVKPVITASAYAWAHTVMTEAKEHVFLFLPFLTLVIMLSVWLVSAQVTSSSGLKRSLVWLAGVTTVLGIIITLSGVLISGAVRK
ncbi:MAG: hypothetical protein HY421_02860 [Candidatus Kerfeldbacteria bacterium]|nr:hypothetical protein [Candidatus Kerfeldbacteria bacterium]